eukprot:1068317-Lingulodinium_polyedra.AAC.1
MQPMTRSRQQIGDVIAGPTYQHAANQLVFSHAGGWHHITIVEQGGASGTSRPTARASPGTA